MTIYRQARPEERNEYVDLANHTFGFDIEELLPKVYYKGDHSDRITKVAETESGKLVAENAVLPQTVHASGKTLLANFLGIMVVDPKYRGEGHMKELMKLQLEEMSGQYHISILGGQRQRYEYFGYTSGGVQYRYHINISNIRHALKDTDSNEILFSPFFEIAGWEKLLPRIFASREVYVERNPDTLQSLFTSYHQHPWGIQKNGTLIGYLISSEDHSTVSELALLSPQDTKKVIKAYFHQFHLKSSSFLFPEYEVAICKEVSDFAEYYQIQPSNMYNIFDFATVLDMFLTVKSRTCGLSDGFFSAVMDHQPITITVCQNHVRVESHAAKDAVHLSKMDAQKLLLTPYGRYMELSVPLDWFPLPLFWYTVDCF